MRRQPWPGVSRIAAPTTRRVGAMRISHGRSGAPSIEQGPTFTGQVWADPVVPAQDGVLVNNVFCEPGSRTHWHRHGVGQVLYVTIGGGWVQKRDGEGGRLRS